MRKSSWDQTSIQWHASAVAACVERRASTTRPGPNGATFLGCAALQESVRQASVQGEIPVVDDDPLPVNDARDLSPA